MSKKSKLDFLQKYLSKNKKKAKKKKRKARQLFKVIDQELDVFKQPGSDPDGADQENEAP